MAERLTFVHAADLHLDAPFRRVEAIDPRVREACVEATFAAFDRIVDVCLERDAAFLIIAGDTYNTAERSFRAQSRFRSAAQRLAEAGIAVYVVGGNHDPLSRGPVSLEMPETVHVFSGDSVERIAHPADGDQLCVLYGRSFARSKETANLAREFRRQDGDRFAIGVLHANVGGNQQYEPYAPCTLDDLKAARMDYWALGHIHQHQKLSDDPLVVYPGSPQGLDPNEAGGHGCVVVTVSPTGVATTEFIETGVVAWEHRSIDLTDAATLDDVLAALHDACAAARTAADARPVLVRVDVSGRSETHAQLASPAVFEEILEEVRAEQMSMVPWVWLDRVRDLTQPVLDLERVRQGADFAGDLVRAADALGAEEAAALVDEVLEPIRAATRDVALDPDPASVLERARDLCLDRLLDEKASG